MRGRYLSLLALVALTGIGLVRGQAVALDPQPRAPNGNSSQPPAKVAGSDAAKPSKASPVEEAQKVFDQAQAVAQEAKRKAATDVDQKFRRAIRRAKQAYLQALNVAFKAVMADAKLDDAKKLEEANRIDILRKRAEADLKALDGAETPVPLTLDAYEISVAQGKDVWIRVAAGDIQKAESKSATLKVAIDPEKGLKISADAKAPLGDYPVVVKGSAGPEVIVKVVVLPALVVPGVSPNMPASVPAPLHIELGEKENATRRIKVTEGKAVSVKLKELAKGLTVAIEDRGKTIRINAANNIKAGRYDVIVTGEDKSTVDIAVLVKSASISLKK